MAPTSTELVLGWPSLTALPATSGFFLDVSAKLQLVPSLLSSWDLKTGSWLRAGSIKGKNCATSRVIHLPAITAASAQTRHRPPGVVRASLALPAPPLRGNGKVARGRPGPISIPEQLCPGWLHMQSSLPSSKLQQEPLARRDSPSITQADSAGGWVMAPGRAAEQTGLPRQRCASISSLGPSLPMGTNSSWIFPTSSANVHPSRVLFYWLHLKFWCPLQTTGHLRFNKTTDLVCKKKKKISSSLRVVLQDTWMRKDMSECHSPQWHPRRSQLGCPCWRWHGGWHALQVFPQWRSCLGWAEVLKKAKPRCSVFVHVEGVPRSQSVWDSRSQRKLLRLLEEEEVGVPRLEAGRALVFPERRGGGGGKPEKGAQPKKRARKEEAWKVCCWCGRGGEGWERSFSLQLVPAERRTQLLRDVGERAEVLSWRE